MGRIGPTIASSTPSFLPPRRPPADAPNVVVVVLDDTGFAQLGCYGSDIATPNVDACARDGLRFNRFHVTSLCSPTRACVLTGRNHHAVGMGLVPEVPMGFPGYTGRIPRAAAPLPRILREVGYSTLAVGKWHLTPRWEMTASGPFDHWPLGLGFERFYGFLGADTNQWAPALLACDNHFVAPPRPPEAGYHLTEDLADQAIRMLVDQQQATPDKPFFLYFATGAMHAPHHVPEPWVEPYRGRFDDGWDAWRDRVVERQRQLGIVPRDSEPSSRPSWVTAWRELPDDERRLYARMMELYAGFLTHTDAQLGRVVEALRDLDVLDDTLVFVLSDNGASAEGGPHGSHNENVFAHGLGDTLLDVQAHADELGGLRTYNHYAWGWAWAGNAPFRLWKRYAWLGGIRTPLIVRWPRGVEARDEVRGQFCHAVDLAPTVLDAVGIDPPARIDGVDQRPFDGDSLLSVFDDPTEESPHTVQYFEMFGSRAIYADGWKAVTDHVGDQLAAERALIPGSHDFDRDRWALFNLDRDFAEVHDQAEQDPDRLRRLVELWWTEAGRNQVLPIDDTMIGRAVALEPSPHGPRNRYRLFPGTRVAEDAAPPLGGDFTILADLEVLEPRVDGVLLAQGDWTSGWALYVLAGQVVFAFNYLGSEVHRVRAERALAAGRAALRVDVRREDPRRARCSFQIDGASAGAGEIPRGFPFRWQIGGSMLHVGADAGLPVCDDYEPPFEFSGKIRSLVIEVPGPGDSNPRPRLDQALRGD